ncbi:MAG: NAD-binding protein [Bacilli bacterium]|nr:NAD-binding protein [Bacilli bacterium]
MKIVIAGGTHDAEYLVQMFNTRKNKLIVINNDPVESNLILKREKVAVYTGDPWRYYVLEESGSKNADILVSLLDNDVDNYATCILAKNCFGIKKCICVVNNPRNVELYKTLGIDTVVSATYLLGQTVKSESSVEDLIKTLSIENDKIIMVEVPVLAKYAIAGKKIMDIKFPKYASISCIYRDPTVVIPNGQVELKVRDKLLLVCAPEDEKKLRAFITKEKED